MTVYVDSNIFIYTAFRHPEFGKQCTDFLQRVQQKKIVAATSALTLCEVHHAVRKHISKEAAELVIQGIFSLPLKVVALDAHIFFSALHQVHEHTLKINDAVHFAVALATHSESVYSYDKDFDGLEIPRQEPS